MIIVWSKVFPVIASIVIIITVAIVREFSPTIAAITATMPINIPLALWIAGANSSPDELDQFANGMMLGIGPTVLYLITAWLLIRAGWGTVPVIIVGYVVWGLSLGAILLVRSLVGG